MRDFSFCVVDLEPSIRREEKTGMGMAGLKGIRRMEKQDMFGGLERRSENRAPRFSTGLSILRLPSRSF